MLVDLFGGFFVKVLQCAADSPAYLVAGLVVDRCFSRSPYVASFFSSLCGEHGFSLTHSPVLKPLQFKYLGDFLSDGYLA